MKMKIELNEILARNLVEDYIDNDEEGVFGIYPQVSLRYTCGAVNHSSTHCGATEYLPPGA